MEALAAKLSAQKALRGTDADLFTGIFHRRLGEAVARRAKSGETPELARIIKNYRLSVLGPGDTQHAQVTRGGADVSEFDSETMESRRVPGLYAVGEALDIDGACGGYNLHWAFASGCAREGAPRVIEVRDVRLALDGDLKAACAKKLRVPVGDVLEAALLRRSVDARRKDDVHFTVTAAVSLRRGEEKFSPYTPWTPPRVEVLKKKPALRPVVCGAGPAGLFRRAHARARGRGPILLPSSGQRRGRAEGRRGKILSDPRAGHRIDIQFGEGGAGAFSDGKLNTGTHDKRGRQVLHDLVQAGAPDEILWQAKPHIGTDRLPDAVKGLREMILAHGGEVRFRTKLTDIELSGGALRAVRLAHGGAEEALEADTLILAAGHSARELFALLKERGAQLEQKAFSMGVRCDTRRRSSPGAQYGALPLTRRWGRCRLPAAVHLPGRAGRIYVLHVSGRVRRRRGE